jgi:hypothetical protein
VLHWLAEEKWHWIITDFNRLNTRTCGMEWLSTPLIAFLGTDRWVFLINAAAFPLLPGMFFGVLRQLGASGRTARQWMWLLPTGYCYLIQAGSIANDMFGAVFALAAVNYALHARRTGCAGDVWLSVLAAALMTGAKATNLPLLLPWAIALLPAWRIVLRYPLRAAGIAVCAAMVSFLPTAALNVKHCGDWTGLRAEPAELLGGDPLFHLGVNAVLLTEQNFCPPIFPFASQWNRKMEAIIPPGLGQKLSARFEPAGARFKLGEMQMEESAGLGFGVSALLVLAVGWRLKRGGFVSREWRRRLCSLESLVVVGAWVAAGVFMAQSGLSPAARYLTPFYCLMLALFLSGGTYDQLWRRRWWRYATGGVLALAGLLLVVVPTRPLWPATTLLQSAGANASAHPLLVRAWTVYSVYDKRADAFAPACARLPDEANPLGLISFDDPETSLWRPFGTRRILHIPQAETAQSMRARGIEYVLASSETLTNNWKSSLGAWLLHADGEVAEQVPLELRAGRGPKEWYLIRLR